MRLRAAPLLALLVLLQAALPASAAEEVLIESLPANIEKSIAVAIARDALTYREWTIVAQDANSVSAKISRSNIDANIRIKVSGTRLVYEESARGKPKLDYTGRMVPTTITTPARWISYLRADITEDLMKRAAAGPAKAAPTVEKASEEQVAAKPGGPAVQRMQELKEMFDRGLISADEYARKKADILKDL